MNELALEIEKTMTTEKVVMTKELAEMLGVSERTVRDTASKIGVETNFRTLGTAGGNQSIRVFNKKQATAIKIELQNHTKIAKNGFDTLTISNDLEMLAIQQRLNEYQSHRIKELQAENEAQKQRLAIVEPKAKWYDDFADCTGLIEIGVVGKHLEIYGLGAKKIFKRLKDDGIIYEMTVDGVKKYSAYFCNRQYFAYRNGRLMCTKAGAQWLESKYSLQA